MGRETSPIWPIATATPWWARPDAIVTTAGVPPPSVVASKKRASPVPS